MLHGREDPTVDRLSSVSLTPAHEQSLTRYCKRLLSEPVTPRQWVQANPQVEPTPTFRKMLWAQYSVSYPPPRVPGFIIEDVLGEGGMGRVYLGHDKALSRLVAIKEVTRVLRRGGPEADRFRREAKIIAKLEHHPNIVKVHQFAVNQGREFIVMEYLANGSLADRLNRTVHDVFTAIPLLIAKLALAIDYAHANKIIHRDLKPGNILFDKNDEPKLSDFGLAKDMSDPTDLSHGAVMGTHHYMAPEQVSGSTPVPGTDIWALGVILFRVFSGRFPFDGRTVADVYEAIRKSGPVELPAEVPAELRRICFKCLEKDANRRYLSGRQLADDLKNAVSPDLAVTILAPSKRRAAGVFSRVRARWRVAVLALSLAAAGAVIVAALLRHGRTPTPRPQVAQTLETLGAMREKLPGPSRSVCFTPDGRYGLSEAAGSKILVWDLLKGQLEKPLVNGLGADGDCGVVAASNDGRFIAALGTNAALGGLRFFELRDATTFDKVPEAEKVLSFFDEFSRTAAFSPDSRLIAVGTHGTKDKLAVYDIEKQGWSEIPLPAPLTCSAFSPDGSLAVTGSTEASVCIWDLAKRAKYREIPVPAGGIDEVAFSQDGSRIYAASIASDSLSTITVAGEVEKTLATKSSTPEKMTCAAISSLGKAISGHRDGTIVCWDLKTGVNISAARPGAEVDAVAISQDGREALAEYSDQTVVHYRIAQPNTLNAPSDK